MGDFTKILDSMPAFTCPGLRESFIDVNGLEIVRITPLDGSGVVYFSTVQVGTTQGPMTLRFPLPVDSIEAAVAGWQEAARAAVRQFGEKMREHQRRIVLPSNPAANTAPFKIIN